MIKILLELLYHMIGGIFLLMLTADKISRYILRENRELDRQEAEIVSSLIETMEGLEKRRLMLSE